MGAAGSVMDSALDAELSNQENVKAGSPGKLRIIGDDNIAASSAAANETILQGKSIALTKPQIFKVRLLKWAEAPPGMVGSDLKLSLGRESADLVDKDTLLPSYQFPYHNIACWGACADKFEFKVFSCEIDELSTQTVKVPVILETRDGKKIEDAIMTAVRHLMAEMEKTVMTKEEFGTLISCIFDEEENLIDGWMKIIDQFTSSRNFIAKQGITLLARVGRNAPFDRLDLACLIYERLLNKESFQLIINSFVDTQERDNLIMRLKLTNQKTTSFKAVSNCNSISDIKVDTTS